MRAQRDNSEPSKSAIQIGGWGEKAYATPTAKSISVSLSVRVVRVSEAVCAPQDARFRWLLFSMACGIGAEFVLAVVEQNVLELVHTKPAAGPALWTRSV